MIVLFYNHLTSYEPYEFYFSVNCGLLIEFSCCFRTVLFNIVPRDPPVHYCAFYAIQKVHFILTLVSLGFKNEHYTEVAVYVVIKTLMEKNSQLPKSKGLITQFG